MTKFYEKSVLEKNIEAAVIAFAELRGWWTCKFVSPGLRGVPDRILIRKGRVIFIEFKKPGEAPTEQQAKRHREMRAAGVEVFWFSALDIAKQILL